MRLYGLIGNPLTHSFSKKYFSEKFSREGITGCRYELFPLQSINELPQLLKDHPSLCGLNVTIPYKEQVLPFAGSQDEVVRSMHASNCLRVVDGQLHAYNTDVAGFRQSLLQGWTTDHRHALVLGTGGASKAVIYVLEKLGVSITVVSRTRSAVTISYNDVDEEMMRRHTLVVNTTPLGTFPDVSSFPSLPYRFVSPAHYFFDLVYNPPLTRFLALAQEQGASIRNGADMLTIQAEESWKIWNAE